MWNRGRRQFVLGVAFSIVPAGLVAASPEPVSPGRTGEPGVIAERCPTFSWSAWPFSGGGREVAYEIALYTLNWRRGDEPVAFVAPVASAYLTPLFSVEVAGAATSWTPSLDQCLEPGGFYAWFVRVRLSGREPMHEDWSHGLSFEVDTSAARASEADVAAVVKDLKHVEIQLDRIAQSGAVAPQGLEDLDLLPQIHSLVGAVHTRMVPMFAKVVTDADAIHPTVLDIQKKLNAVGVKTDETRLATTTIQEILSEGRALITPEIRRTLEQAFEQAAFSATSELQGMDDFLGPGVPCAQATECSGFRSLLLAKVDDLAELLRANLELPRAVDATAPPRLDSGLLRSAIEAVPGAALYPLHKLLVVKSDSLESLNLRDLAEDLRAVRPLFAEEAPQRSSCELVNDLSEVSRRLFRGGATLRTTGMLLQAAGETSVDGKVDAAVIGAVIKNNFPKQLGSIVDGLGQALLQGSGTITQRQRHCELLAGQDRILAALPPSQDIQNLVTGVTALTHDLAAGGKLDIGAIAATLSSVDGSVGGLATRLTAVDADVDAVAAALKTHDGALAGHDARLTTVASALGAAASAHELRLAEHHDAVSTSVAGLDGRLAGVVRGLEALSARVDGIQAAAKAMDDRSIEQQLASCQGLVSLFLPAAFGGSLESVVEVARSSISRSKDAGLDTRNAERFLEKAEREIVARRFSKAFDLLCKAYPARTAGDS